MKYEPDNPDFWDEVDRRQVQYTELRLSRSDNELDYNNADIPRRRHDPLGDLLDQKSIHFSEWQLEASDPLRAANGILRMTAIAIVFWATLIGIVWLANAYL